MLVSIVSVHARACVSVCVGAYERVSVGVCVFVCACVCLCLCL